MYVEWEILVGDLEQKISIIAASGDYHDAIAARNRTYVLHDAGAFIPLNDLLDQYGQDILKLWGKNVKLIKQEEGQVYWLPQTMPYGDKVRKTREGHGVHIQKAVLKEFGYPKLKSLEEGLDLLMKYARKYPEINGNRLRLVLTSMHMSCTNCTTRCISKVCMTSGGTSFSRRKSSRMQATEGLGISVGCKNPAALVKYFNFLSPYELEVLEAYDQDTFATFYRDPDLRRTLYSPAWSITYPAGSEIEIADRKIKDLRPKYYPLLIMADAGAYDKVWNQLMKEYETSGVKDMVPKVIDFLQEGIDKRAEINGGYEMYQ